MSLITTYMSHVSDNIIHGFRIPFVLRWQGISSISPYEFRALWPNVSYVFDGGVLDEERQGSTIVDLTQTSHGVFEILREGAGLEGVRQVIGLF